MEVERFTINGLILFKPVRHKDNRGYFAEIYHHERYQKYLPPGTIFVQDNLSFSKFGTIRGLHYQKEPFEQAKLVRCTQGKILDVAVDIRRGSPSYGKYISIELSAQNGYQLFVSKGFAHGFSVLSPEAVVEYKCDEYFLPEADTGIRYDDEQLGIDWFIDLRDHIVSEKDRNLSLFRELV